MIWVSEGARWAYEVERLGPDSSCVLGSKGAWKAVELEGLWPDSSRELGAEGWIGETETPWAPRLILAAPPLIQTAVKEE